MNREFNFLNEDTLTVDKFPKICRLCFSCTNLKPIFGLKYKEFGFHRIFELCTAVYIKEGDALPQNICFVCFNEIIRFYTFRLKAQQSNTLLKSLFTNLSDVHSEIHIKNESNEKLELLKKESQEQLKEENNEKTNEQEEHKQPTCRKSTSFTSKKTLKGQTYNCTGCNETFPSIKKLWHHCRLSGHQRPKPHKCSTCGRMFSKKYHVRQHSKTHNKEKPFMCWYCGVRFSFIGNLNRHMRQHTGERPYICETCGKSFLRSTQLAEHTTVHTGEKQYLCSSCGKRFSSLTVLRKHKECHSKFKYSCSDCGKGFPTELRLQNHKSIGCNLLAIQGEKPFSCMTCGKICSSRATLWQHAKQHSDFRPYICKTCNKSFRYAGGLTLHSRIHTGVKPYVCDVCEHSFTQRQHLTYHLRTHSGERPYICNHCGKGFALKGNLTVHVRTHTKETTHNCDVCGKGFYDTSNLKKHKQRKHETAADYEEKVE